MWEIVSVLFVYEYKRIVRFSNLRYCISKDVLIHKYFTQFFLLSLIHSSSEQFSSFKPPTVHLFQYTFLLFLLLFYYLNFQGHLWDFIKRGYSSVQHVVDSIEHPSWYAFVIFMLSVVNICSLERKFCFSLLKFIGEAWNI